MVQIEKPLEYYSSSEIETTLKTLQSQENGLSDEEAAERLRQFGKNILLAEKRHHPLLKLLQSFNSPLTIILLLAAFVSFSLQESVNGSIIAAIVVISGLLNFFQEHRADQAAEKLRSKVATTATVLRRGKEEEVRVPLVCVGDIIALRAGGLVPADARIISAKDFFVNQSSLTGESFPVEKSALVTKGTSLTDMTNIVFAGTNVITGTAQAVVFRVGGNSEIGEIGQKMAERPLPSEFTNGIKNFSLLIMRTTIFFVLFIFLFNAFIKHGNIFETFTFAIAVAVGLTPELLPVILSVTMANGSLKMAKKGVIVKKLSAIPNFGSMDVLCTDKTGTLTEDHIEVVKYTDVFGQTSERVLQSAYLTSSMQTGIKNPMDDALLQFRKMENHGYTKIDEIPFDFERKKMSIIVEKTKKRYIITKGAPEEVFTASTYCLKGGKEVQLTQTIKKSVVEQFQSLSKQGYRVLAVGIREVESTRSVYEKSDEDKLELLGFISFLDPAKQGVKTVLQDLHAMGIEVKVLTGDNELVTKKICEDVGLPIKGLVLGHQIASLSEDALRVIVEKNTIFARFSPGDKDRVIQALQKNKHVVGYMGDGINDAPSLKAADVGLSVNNAVDVAKESADMILTHKSLKELGEGVIEGRKTFGNTMKYIMMGISSSFGNMFSVLGAVLFIPFLPMLPIQILLNNLLYDFSQITIPTDAVDSEFTQSPKRWDINFIKDFMFIFGPLSSIFDFITFYVMYVFFKASPGLFQTAWFLESLATQTLVILIIRTRKLPFIESSPSKYLLISTVGVVLLAWLLPFVPLGQFFSFVSPSVGVVAALLLITMWYLVAAEVGKRFFYRKYSL